jgi:hydrogenase maturation protease
MADCSMRCAVADILVIGYGNELRGDDGLGPLVAKAVAHANLPGVHVMTARQLLPELAVDLAEARLAVFVDTSMESSEIGVAVRSLAVEDTMDWCTHHADPGVLLALTRAVYGRAPDAWWLTAPGRNFEFGERLSGLAEENARQALACLKRLIRAKTQRHRARPVSRCAALNQ